MEQQGLVPSEHNSAFPMKMLEECCADLESALYACQCLIFFSVELIKHYWWCVMWSWVFKWSVVGLFRLPGI